MTTTQFAAEQKARPRRLLAKANYVRIGQNCNPCPTCDRVVEVHRMSDHQRYAHGS